ncbi:MAG: chromosome partitioning protein [Methanomicrobiales archaeon HGW-Methanomicrobiales-4]|nr:MAG: chromosome partitioning protein [Methanomicrobiales archaeon HGW-Methanomicrobiales-4]
MYKFKETELLNRYISACTLYEGIGIAVIAFAHHKGGTGKTTSCLQVAGFLAKTGRRVLVVDTDPQANATLGLGIHPDTPAQNIYHLYLAYGDPDASRVSLSDLIVRTVSGIDLVPSHLDLVGAEPVLYQCAERYTILKKEISAVKNRYDHILIDTPPFLGQFVLNGLIAADKNVLVFSPDSFAWNGYENIRLILADIEEFLGDTISIHMAILNRWERQESQQSLFDRLSTFFGREKSKGIDPGEEIKKLLEDQMRRDIGSVYLVPDSQAVSGSNRRGMPLAFSNPEDPAAQAFSLIAGVLDQK